MSTAIAIGGGSGGAYSLTGGLLSTSRESIGGSSGVFTQSGGTNSQPV